MKPGCAIAQHHPFFSDVVKAARMDGGSLTAETRYVSRHTRSDVMYLADKRNKLIRSYTHTMAVNSKYNSSALSQPSADATDLQLKLVTAWYRCSIYMGSRGQDSVK